MHIVHRNIYEFKSIYPHTGKEDLLAKGYNMMNVIFITYQTDSRHIVFTT
jgi:hypothetical protein